MSEQFQRWYEKDEVLTKCINTLETIEDKHKRQTATYLTEEIITKPPFSDLIPDEVFKMATGESSRRRWYDFDEVVRLFVELLRHAPVERQREIAVKAMIFINDLE